MLRQPTQYAAQAIYISRAVALFIMLMGVAALAFMLGVYPQPLLELVQQASLVALLP